VSWSPLGWNNRPLIQINLFAEEPRPLASVDVRAAALLRTRLRPRTRGALLEHRRERAAVVCPRPVGAVLHGAAARTRRFGSPGGAWARRSRAEAHGRRRRSTRTAVRTAGARTSRPGRHSEPRRRPGRVRHRSGLVPPCPRPVRWNGPASCRVARPGHRPCRSPRRPCPGPLGRARQPDTATRRVNRRAPGARAPEPARSSRPDAAQRSGAVPPAVQRQSRSRPAAPYLSAVPRAVAAVRRRRAAQCACAVAAVRRRRAAQRPGTVAAVRRRRPAQCTRRHRGRRSRAAQCPRPVAARRAAPCSAAPLCRRGRPVAPCSAAPLRRRGPPVAPCSAVLLRRRGRPRPRPVLRVGAAAAARPRRRAAAHAVTSRLAAGPVRVARQAVHRRAVRRRRGDTCSAHRERRAVRLRGRPAADLGARRLRAEHHHARLRGKRRGHRRVRDRAAGRHPYEAISPRLRRRSRPPRTPSSISTSASASRASSSR
jgi:hypothetical protein